MPHLRSAAAAARRRCRAAELGFLRSTPVGVKAITVPERVAKPTKIMALALERHCCLDALSGKESHTLRAAALAARPLVAADFIKASLELNKRAGGAKHNVSKRAGLRVSWADALVEEEAEAAAGADPWFLGADPWMGALALSPARSFCPTSSCPDSASPCFDNGGGVLAFLESDSPPPSGGVTPAGFQDASSQTAGLSTTASLADASVQTDPEIEPIAADGGACKLDPLAPEFVPFGLELDRLASLSAQLCVQIREVDDLRTSVRSQAVSVRQELQQCITDALPLITAEVLAAVAAAPDAPLPGVDRLLSQFRQITMQIDRRLKCDLELFKGHVLSELNARRAGAIDYADLSVLEPEPQASPAAIGGDDVPKPDFAFSGFALFRATVRVTYDFSAFLAKATLASLDADGARPGRRSCDFA